MAMHTLSLRNTSLLAGMVLGLAATSAAADPGKKAAPKAPEAVLVSTLSQMAAPAAQTGQANHSDDPDMGDDNAAANAILTVCTKDTPAADRSAICPGTSTPESPE